MNNHIRWYDKDENLSQFFAFLENLDTRKQVIIAKEILQIIFTELNITPDEKITTLLALKHEHNKRWYDENIDVQSGIELIKNLSKAEQKELLLRIVETIQQLIFKNRFD